MTCNVFTSKLINVRPNTGMDLRKFFKPNESNTTMVDVSTDQEYQKATIIYLLQNIHSSESVYNSKQMCQSCGVSTTLMLKKK